MIHEGIFDSRIPWSSVDTELRRMALKRLSKSRKSDTGSQPHNEWKLTAKATKQVAFMAEQILNSMDSAAIARECRPDLPKSE